MALTLALPRRRLLILVAFFTTLTLSLSYFLLDPALRSSVVEAVRPGDHGGQPPPPASQPAEPPVPEPPVPEPPVPEPPIPEPPVSEPPPSEPQPPKPKYKPTPTYTPPPLTDPFPLLATSTPPPIPEWNRPRPDMHKQYDLPVAPPLLIGFTRNWAVLLQAVVSYITAGWPPSQIYVVENTGTQQANTRGQLTLQNPFYLNHTQLHALGVNIIQTPVLLTFAQLQNFYLSLSYTREWPYYFWSHMDVIALSYEDGGPDGTTPPYWSRDYKTLYQLACEALADARRSDPKWSLRLFAYDHLALVNPAALEDVGGWDTLIPYYLTDCDLHSRLTMRGWNQRDAQAGIIADVSSTLDDLRALYRDRSVTTSWTDPNPPPPEDKDKAAEKSRREGAGKSGQDDANLEYWRSLKRAANVMTEYKYGDRGRNTWQSAQRGGEGEPFSYDPVGLEEAIGVMIEAGREVYRRKWGHRDCDLLSATRLGLDDAWKVEKDWE